MKERLLGRNCDIASSPQWLSSVSRIKLFTRMGGPHLTVPNSDTTNELNFSINLITFGFFTAPRHPITNRANWPTESELNLNEKQREALIEASTKSLSIILGPPGTGKSKVGVKIIKQCSLITNIGVGKCNAPLLNESLIIWKA